MIMQLQDVEHCTQQYDAPLLDGGRLVTQEERDLFIQLYTKNTENSTQKDFASQETSIDTQDMNSLQDLFASKNVSTHPSNNVCRLDDSKSCAVARQQDEPLQSPGSEIQQNDNPLTAQQTLGSAKKSPSQADIPLGAQQKGNPTIGQKTVEPEIRNVDIPLGAQQKGNPTIGQKTVEPEIRNADIPLGSQQKGDPTIGQKTVEPEIRNADVPLGAQQKGDPTIIQKTIDPKNWNTDIPLGAQQKGDSTIGQSPFWQKEANTLYAEQTQQTAQESAVQSGLQGNATLNAAQTGQSAQQGESEVLNAAFKGTQQGVAVGQANQNLHAENTVNTRGAQYEQAKRTDVENRMPQAGVEQKSAVDEYEGKTRKKDTFTNKVEQQSSMPSNVSFFENMFGSRLETVETSAPQRGNLQDVQDFVEKVASKILVSESSLGNKEVQITLGDGSLSGVEMRILRSNDGQLVVHIQCPNSSVFQSAVQGRQDLVSILESKGEQVRVEIDTLGTNSESELGDSDQGEQHQRRSRGLDYFYEEGF